MNEELLQDAKRAIYAVFSDTSVPKSITKETLEELLADIEIMLQSLDNEE